MKCATEVCKDVVKHASPGMESAVSISEIEPVHISEEERSFRRRKIIEAVISRHAKGTSVVQ